MTTLRFIAISFLALGLLFTPDGKANNVPGGANLVESGPHHRTWAISVLSENESGEIVARTNSYQEVATGLNFWDPATEQWKESKEEVIAYPNGAAATNGQHKVIFASDLDTAVAIDMVTPDGKRLQSHILGLSYQDVASGSNVLIAEMKSSVGVILPPNQVIYQDAFTDFKADVLYTYTRAGFEQDVILREQPPVPEMFGLDSASSVLQVITEFESPPVPTIRNGAIAAGTDSTLPDQTLNFGATRIGSGRAFSLGQSSLGGIPVSKEWTTLEGRTLLVEQVSVPAVAEKLDELPAPHQASLPSGNGAARRMASEKRFLPKPKLAKAGKSGMKTASLSPTSSKGFVLDYATININQTNCTFRGDTTYYLSGNVSLNGTNSTFEGGAILKYATNVSLTINTPVTWLASTYRPVIMVSKDDNSVGDTISGSTASPTNRLAARVIYFDAVTANTNLTIQNLRVGQAQTAIAINGGSGHVLGHVQLVTCNNGLAVTNTDVCLRNALFDQVLTNFTGSSSTGRVEHLTVDGANWFNKDIGTNLYVTNSLLVAVTNWGSFVSVNNATNSTGSGVFQTAGAGAHYLADGSTNRNAGTTSVNAALAVELKKRTTSPPLLISNVTYSTSTMWRPVVQRDTDLPDLGYHSAALDYLVSRVSLTSGATLTFGEGVAVAACGGFGIMPYSGSRIYSSGNAIVHNQFCPYQLVQEKPLTFNTSTFALVSFTSGIIDAKFTDIHGVSGIYGILMPFGEGDGQLKFKDCFLGYGTVSVQSPSGGNSSPHTLTNNLFERLSFTIGTFDYETPVFFYNNTVRNSAVQIDHDYGTLNYRTIRNNLFDNSSLTVPFPSLVTFDHNAYHKSTTAITNHTGDFTVTSLVYASPSGGLGNFYIDTGATSPTLVDKGNGSVDLAGLYHYTETSDRAKDTSTVDIGFHYVATDADGNPLDDDSDGVPDYLEDSNGNGSVDSGETRWDGSEGASDPGLKVWITRPSKGSLLP